MYVMQSGKEKDAAFPGTEQDEATCPTLCKPEQYFIYIIFKKN